MDLATIVCEYIYGAFKVVKTAIDVLLEYFEIAIEKLYSIAMSMNNVIFATLSKGLDAILLIVTQALNALVSAMNQSFNGSWTLCAPAFKCNFLLEQILDPDSLIAKTIRKILTSKDDCYCRQEGAIYDIQQTLFDIATDYENFKSQVCNGLSLDLAVDMATDLCLGYLGQLNSWKYKIQSKIGMLRKKLQALVDSFKASRLFALLEELQAFFECVIDSEICANVDTAKSYYNYVLSKLGIIQAGDGEYMLSNSVENEIVGTANSFLAKVNEGIKRVEGIIDSLSCSVSVKGASNALDLTPSIIGIVGVAKDAVTGNSINWNRIPIVDYTNKKIEDLDNAFNRLLGKSTNDPNYALRSNRCYTLNDVLLETVADVANETPIEYLEVEPGTDTSHAQELIQVGDKFYTVADAAKQLYTGTGDPALINYCRTIGGLMNIEDIVVRY